MFELHSAGTVTAPNGLEKEQWGRGGGGLLPLTHPLEKTAPRV